jgi:hypothetical protein
LVLKEGPFVKKFLVFVLAGLTVFPAGSCRTEDKAVTAREPAGVQPGGTEWEYKGIKVLDDAPSPGGFPFASFNPRPDGSVLSIFTGKSIEAASPLHEIPGFDGKLIVRLEEEYSLYGKENRAVFYGMVFDFIKDVSDDTPVRRGDVLGRTGDSAAKLLVFSETLDPYLVLNTRTIPVYYGGYFWFDPAFLSATGSTRWLSFAPVENINDEL